jgi:methylmalonyl-CoA mutase N-terminal domain/subunit
MYRGKLWTMRQFAGFGSARSTNERFKYLLAHGSHGLSVAFDLPTLMGRDSDDELSIGEVGRCGVAIDTIEDMHRLYADIPVGQVTVSQTINGPAAVIWAMYLAMAEKAEDNAYRVGTIDSNETQPVASAQTQVIFAAPNHLLFVRDRTLMAQPFDATALKTTGEPVPLAEGETKN